MMAKLPKQDSECLELLSEISILVYDFNKELSILRDNSDICDRINEWLYNIMGKITKLGSLKPKIQYLKDASYVYTMAMAKIAGYLNCIGITTLEKSLALRIVNYIVNINYIAMFNKYTDTLDLEQCCKSYRQLLDDTRFFHCPTLSAYNPVDFLTQFSDDEFICKTIEIMSQYVAY
jgi:hypothetical protein